MPRKKEKLDLAKHHAERLGPLSAKTPFVLRITEWRDTPIPVLVVKERQYRDDGVVTKGMDGQRRRARPVLIDRGSLSGEPLHRCLPVLRRIVEGVTDAAGVPLELARYLTAEGLRTRGNLPLDEEAGAKLADSRTWIASSSSPIGSTSSRAKRPPTGYRAPPASARPPTAGRSPGCEPC